MFSRTGSSSTSSSILRQVTQSRAGSRGRNTGVDVFPSLLNRVFDPMSIVGGEEEEDLFEPVPLAAHSFPGEQQQQTREQGLRDFLDVILDQVILDVVDDTENSFLLDSALDNLNSSNKRTVANVPSMPQPGMKRRRLSGDMNAHADDEITIARFRPYQQQQWDIQFQELLEFRQKNGHCCVPHTFEENSILSRWVKRQRYQYKLRQEGKPSTITAHRVHQLETAGFVWDSHAAAWEERLNDLKLYSLQRGHCNVPSTCSENRKLATWVKCQRRQYKLFCAGEPSNITADRINDLNKVGFKWDMRGASKNQL